MTMANAFSTHGVLEAMDIEKPQARPREGCPKPLLCVISREALNYPVWCG